MVTKWTQDNRYTELSHKKNLLFLFTIQDFILGNLHKNGTPIHPSGEIFISRTMTILKPIEELHPGTTLAGKYKIIKVSGRGDMGIVYKAEDTKLKCSVALKFLPPELIQDEEAKERFVLEARAAY